MLKKSTWTAALAAGAIAVLFSAAPAYAGNSDPKAPNPSTLHGICSNLGQVHEGGSIGGGATNDGSRGGWNVKSVHDNPHETRIELDYIAAPPVVAVTIYCR